MEPIGRKHTMEEGLEDDDYPCKRIKEWDSWDDLGGLMQSRIPKTNGRWKDEGPLI